MANRTLHSYNCLGIGLIWLTDVFMMDTWWNEAIEQQAIDRVHRLGQNKPVFVTRYIIKGTVGECFVFDLFSSCLKATQRSES